MNKIRELIYKPINNFKIANKMMLIYVIGGFIPLLLLSFYQIGNTRSILIGEATKEAITNASRIEERLQDIFRITVDVSVGIYLDDQLKQMIRTEYTRRIDVIEDLRDYKKIDDYLRLYPEIESIRMYVDNDTLLDNSQIIPVKDNHKELEWYQLAIKNDGKFVFIYHFDEIKRSNHLSLIRLIKDEYGRSLGVLVININNNTLMKLMGSEPYEVIGIIDNRQVFSSTNTELNGLYLVDMEKIQKLNKLSNTINDYSDGFARYKVIKDEFKTHSSGNNIKLLTIVPIDKFVGFANESIKNSMVLISFSALVALLMVYLLTHILSDRIEEFRMNLHKVATGDFEFDYIIDGSDEIALLFTDLEVMKKSIKELIHQVYEVGLQKEQLASRQREAEFKMLTSQIDPHFLYNTLETIRMEAVINDQNDIADIVKKLAFLMRRKLSVSNDEVSLESELELLSYYIEIQKFRFRERVSFSINRLCDTEDFKILPLLLQPIVENAFIHGLEPKVGHGNLEIIISESEQFLEISIKDNGVGISDNSLKDLKNKIERDMLSFGKSIGLTNVYQRIQIFYKTPYHLSVESEEGIGTIVKFHLPKRSIKVYEEEQ